MDESLGNPNQLSFNLTWPALALMRSARDCAHAPPLSQALAAVPTSTASSSPRRIRASESKAMERGQRPPLSKPEAAALKVTVSTVWRRTATCKRCEERLQSALRLVITAVQVSSSESMRVVGRLPSKLRPASQTSACWQLLSPQRLVI